MRTLILLVLMAWLVLSACNNSSSGDKSADRKDGYSNAPANKVDSLLEEISADHDYGMSKMGKLRGLEKSLSHYLDSMSALTAPVSENTRAHIQSIISVRDDLNKADSMMDAWMEGFKPDSAENNVDVRVRYLESERIKLSKMKEQFVNALTRADSLRESKQ